jgi:hypothetical protein
MRQHSAPMLINASAHGGSFVVIDDVDTGSTCSVVVSLSSVSFFVVVTVDDVADDDDDDGC